MMSNNSGFHISGTHLFMGLVGLIVLIFASRESHQEDRTISSVTLAELAYQITSLENAVKRLENVTKDRFTTVDFELRITPLIDQINDNTQAINLRRDFIDETRIRDAQIARILEENSSDILAIKDRLDILHPQ